MIRLAILGLVLVSAGGCMIMMPGTSYRGELPPRTEAQEALAGVLRTHVRVLSEEIGERHVWRPAALERTAGYIEEQFTSAGFTVQAQSYEASGHTCRNLAVEAKGTGPTTELFVVGAHYDSVPGCPAANDNASGVAALLVLADHFHDRPAEKTIRFVAFVNEEPPFFQTDRMGSLVYAKAARERGDPIVGMYSLETIGSYSDEKGSQRYPFPFSLFYPNIGNFIGFIGNVKSRHLVKESIRSFRKQASFPSEGAAIPSGVEGVGWSDHWSFWQQGYPAVMITDTAPFRYPQYHTAEDTLDKLDFERMARVVEGVEAMLRELAGAQP